jgi:signal transduction histidine kinase/DNA-binding response OmpR family regulator
MKHALRAKLIAIVGTAALAFVSLIVASTLIEERAEHQLTNIQRRYVPKVELEPQLDAQLEKIRRGFQDAVAAHDFDTLAGTSALRDKFFDLLAGARGAVDPVEAAALHQAIEDYYATAQDVSRRLMDGETGEALVNAMTDMQAKNARAAELLKRVATFDKGQLNDAFSQATRAQVEAGRVRLLVSILCLVTVLLLSVWLGYGVWRRLTELTAGLKRFGQGNFERPIDVVSNDELGVVALEANHMAESLQQLEAERVRAAETMEKLNRSLGQQNEELTRATRAKTDFLTKMSHELRTPLNSIIGFSEVMIDGKFGALNERQARYMKNVHASGRHLLGLINDLLDLSKVEAGRLEVALQPCSPRVVMTEAMATLQPVADAGKVKLVLADPQEADADAAEMVSADAFRFKQILYNLLSNAIKFTPPGGQVTLRAESMASFVRVSVTDTGAGISDEDMSRLFTPFTQLENAKEKSGTGLGLVLIKELVGLMGGRMGVKSTVGAGSTFYIELPRIGTGAPSQEKAATESGTTAPLVLVVDDDSDAQELLLLALQSDGYRTLVAKTGEEALTLARQHQPQVITLDVFLPTIDGWDVLRVLRTDPATANIPVVMITMSSDRRTAFALGAVEHLVKPIDRERLVGALRRLGFTTKVTQRTIHILAVDDDPEQLELVRATLQPHGFQIRTELTGRAGLAAALSEPVDLLLLDLVMPDISGIEVIESLRRSVTGKAIPIILITGHDIAADERLRLKGEVEAILAKGEVNTKQLLEHINSVLGANERRPP